MAERDDPCEAILTALHSFDTRTLPHPEKLAATKAALTDLHRHLAEQRRAGDDAGSHQWPPRKIDFDDPDLVNHKTAVDLGPYGKTKLWEIRHEVGFKDQTGYWWFSLTRIFEHYTSPAAGNRGKRDG